jgi:hypothetical protein
MADDYAGSTASTGAAVALSALGTENPAPIGSVEILAGGAQAAAAETDQIVATLGQSLPAETVEQQGSNLIFFNTYTSNVTSDVRRQGF